MSIKHEYFDVYDSCLVGIVGSGGVCESNVRAEYYCFYLIRLMLLVQLMHMLTKPYGFRFMCLWHKLSHNI